MPIFVKFCEKCNSTGPRAAPALFGQRGYKKVPDNVRAVRVLEDGNDISNERNIQHHVAIAVIGEMDYSKRLVL